MIEGIFHGVEIFIPYSRIIITNGWISVYILISTALNFDEIENHVGLWFQIISCVIMKLI
jgi:hypothetical protein